MHRAVIIAVLAIVTIICATLLCGCNQPEFPVKNITNVTPMPSPPYLTNSLNGHVYLDGYAISGAHVEAVSVDGTDIRAITTNDSGAYILNIKPYTKYNITGTYQGLRHTVWPVYLPGETNTYDINLTTMPDSAIEGSGYTIGPGGHPELFERYDHKRWSGVVVTVTSVKDNTTMTTLTDSNGSYSLEVEPNVLYNMTGAFNVHSKFPTPMFHYRNYGGLIEGYFVNITVGPNETALVDYEIPMP